MNLLPLTELRLNARSHASALRWLALVYRRPRQIAEVEKSLSEEQKLAAFLRIYLHALPYLILFNALMYWLLFDYLKPETPVDWFREAEPGTGAWFFGIFAGIMFGTLSELTLGIAFGIAGGIAVGSTVTIIVGIANGITLTWSVLIVIGIASGVALGTASGILFGNAGAVIVGTVVGGIGGNYISSFIDHFNKIMSTYEENYLGGPFDALLFGFVFAITFGVAFSVGFLRLYYIPIHAFWLWPRVRAEIYRFHPVAWDGVCRFPFPGLDRLLVARAECEPEAGEREIERLIDDYPSQRLAALRARAILVARRAAATMDLARLDEVLARLPEGTQGFLRQIPELRRRAHEITALQARLDTLDRPFLREPFAALLVKEIEDFSHQIAGFKPPLSTELRKAARQWLAIAQRQLAAVQTATSREPTRQVFRAGDPVDREREAFVTRASILGELERQVTLASGCPGLLLYGRRRMGKSTLLANLEGFLPPRVQVVRISMQEARAFTSLPDLISLIAQRVASVVPNTPGPPADLKGFERFLAAVHGSLDAADRRLLLALDEYEYLDLKIGEGVFSPDLLAVVRESIQTHRRLIWAFAGSHGIDELSNAPWTSYLVSARTLEVTPFELAETRLLLTEPLKHSSLWRDLESERPRFAPGFWGEGGIERIHAEAGGWPHLVQLVAENLVDLVNDSEGAEIDARLFERALDRAVVRGNNVFLELLEMESRLPGEWEYLLSFRGAEDQPPPADETVARSLRRRLLIREDGGRYRLRVPLMGRWLRQRA